MPDQEKIQESLLVLSEEAALAETLRDELPHCTITEAKPAGAQQALGAGAYRLVVADGDGVDMDSLLTAAGANIVRIARPVRLSDLLYTIHRQLQSKSAPTREEIPIAGGFVLCPAERLLRSQDRQTRIALTEKEAELLSSLARQNGKPLAREALLKAVWGYSDDIATRTLETHIYRLRGKLRQADGQLDIVFSEEGGYLLSGAKT